MEKEKSKSTKFKFKELISDLKENITEGAKALGEMSAELLEEAKEKGEDLYEAGHEKFEQASGVVHDYIDRYKGNREIEKLTEQKEELTAKFGDVVFHEFKKRGTVAKQFLSTKKMSALISEIEHVDKEILRIGKDLDTKSESS